MISADLEALIVADAAGALDVEERQELRESLDSLPPDARVHVSRLYDLTVALAAAADDVAPPPPLRLALLAKLAEPANYTITAQEGAWLDLGLPGIRAKILALDRARDVVTLLVRAQPGARYPAHHHSAPEECYILSGSVRIGGRVLRAGDFHHAEGDTDHGVISTDDGAEVLLVASATDYLPQPPGINR
jgi:quercetin dioxygenase-like cupin family protein